MFIAYSTVDRDVHIFMILTSSTTMVGLSVLTMQYCREEVAGDFNATSWVTFLLTYLDEAVGRYRLVDQVADDAAFRVSVHGVSQKGEASISRLAPGAAGGLRAGIPYPHGGYPAPIQGSFKQMSGYT